MTMSSGPTVWFPRAGSSWFEGLPVGNGRSGAMLWGDSARTVISLNDESFWSPGPASRDFTGARDALRQVRGALSRDDALGAQAAAAPLMGTPTHGAAFQPIGSLSITTDAVPGTQFRRSLELGTGVVRVDEGFQDGSVVERALVAARTPSVFVFRQLAGPAATIRFDSPFGSTMQDGPVFAGRWHEVDPNRHLAAASYRLRDGGGFDRLAYAVGIRVLDTGGTDGARIGGAGVGGGAADGTAAVVLGPGPWSIAVAISTGLDDDENRLAVERRLDAAASVGPDGLYGEAIRAHREVFERSSIRIASSDAASRALQILPTDARVRAVRAGGLDDDLTLVIVDYGRYLLIASSVGGELPPTLQGIWNDDTEPAWSSNWTTNINLQMNLWAADPFHVVEATDALADLVDRISHAGRRTAEQIYGSSGWVLHHNTDYWLNTAPTTMVEVGLFPAAGLWLLQQLWQHDQRYPERQTGARLLPLFEGAIAFLDTWLIVAADGSLVTSPSSSPENGYLIGDTPRPRSRAVDPEYQRHGWLGEAPALDMWLVRDTLQAAIALAQEAGRPPEIVRRWSDMLAQLRPVSIVDGMLPEWTQPRRPLELGHRHLSSLYPVYPGADPEAIDSAWGAAARQTLLSRQSDVESSSNGWGGWSRVWAAAAWARLGDGERALASLESLVRVGIAPASLLHAFPEFDGEPGTDAVHQIDANLGFPAAVAELVVRSNAEAITVLPAVPRRWSNGSVRNLRAWGGVDVSFEWHEGVVAEVTLHCAAARRVRLRAPHGEWETDLPAGRVTTVKLTDATARPRERT